MSTALSARKLRKNNPAPVASTNDSAISDDYQSISQGVRPSAQNTTRREFDARSLERGQNAEHDGGQHGQPHGESKHRVIDMDVANSRQIGRGEVYQREGAPPCQRDAQSSAQNREREALDNQHPYKPGPRCAQRRTNCHLTRPHRGARQQKIRNIGAGDQQYQQHRAQQQVERGPHRAGKLIA